MQKSLALCLITNDADLRKSVDLAFELKPYIDKVYITTTGKERGENSEDGFLNFSHFEWCDDFSQARNFNFSQAKEDWILWLDADDSLQGAERLREVIQNAEENRVEGLAFLYKYGFDAEGNCVDEHWKTQLLKNDGHFEWKGAIHEDPIQLRPVKWGKTDQVVRIHHTTQEKTAESYERNLRILLKEHDKEPNEPRTLFYLGRTYFAAKQFDKVLEYLDEYLALSGWDEERYEARLLIGNSYFQMGQYQEALIEFAEATLEREDYPDAYIYKGMSYMKMDEYNKALYNFKIALNLPLPAANTFFNPMFYTRDLYASIAYCYLQLGKTEDALKGIVKARGYDKKSPYLIDLHALISELQKKYDAARKYVELARYLKEQGRESSIPALLHSVPPSLQDNPVILSLQFSFMKAKEWSDKSIVVYCGNTVETWTPLSQNKGGIGGSETAVIELTKRLAKLGWDVTVYNNCSAPAEGLEFDGVKYMNYWQFNVKDKFNILWDWRLPELYSYEIDAKLKILDLHDVMSVHDLNPDVVKNLDKIFVKTNYHRSLYPNVPDDKFVVIGNGIDLSRFSAKPEKDLKRFIYASTPNRGLDIVLKVWPKILAAIPGATLHTYYGWNTFEKIEKNNPERMAWMAKMKKLMEQPGVVNHGRVGQAELAADELQSSFWLYPTHFPEIHCITACEMQAAGVIPITSGFAALAETQKSGLKLPGDVYDPTWQEQYTDAVIKTATQEPGVIQAQSAQARLMAEDFSWNIVAEEWNKQICESLSSGMA